MENAMGALQALPEELLEVIADFFSRKHPQASIDMSRSQWQMLATIHAQILFHPPNLDR
jgi:septum formation topological specificity factor MinE